MATRGTAIIIDDKKISFGPEFNGDMYADGHGDNFMKLLSEVKDNTEFIIFNNRFNKYNFGYDKIMSSYQGQYDLVEFKNANDVVSMELICNSITSDYTFLKNISKRQIKLEVLDRYNNKVNINVKSGQTIRTYFGTFKNGDRI